MAEKKTLDLPGNDLADTIQIQENNVEVRMKEDNFSVSFLTHKEEDAVKIQKEKVREPIVKEIKEQEDWLQVNKGKESKDNSDDDESDSDSDEESDSSSNESDSDSDSDDDDNGPISDEDSDVRTDVEAGVP